MLLPFLVTVELSSTFRGAGYVKRISSLRDAVGTRLSVCRTPEEEQSPGVPARPDSRSTGVFE